MDERKDKHAQVSVTFNGEKHTLEEWTRKETAADKEKSLDWSGAFPDTNLQGKKDEHPYQPADNREPRNYWPIHPPKKQNRRLPGFSGHQIFQTLRIYWLPATAAIIIGLAIGLTMLILFSGQKQQTSSTWAGGRAAAPAQTAFAPVSRKDLQLTAYFLQAGVYSSKAKAEEAASMLRGRGLAVLTGGQGQTALFVSAVGADSGAQKLSEYYKKQGISVYKKQLRFQAAPKSYALGHAATGNFIKNVRSIILTMDQDPVISGTKIYPRARAVSRLQKQNAALQKLRSGTVVSNRRVATLMANICSIGRNASANALSSQKKQTSAAYAAYQESLLQMIALYQNFIDLPASVSKNNK
ncbi:MAG: SPOR domain-containing protein [Sporolactobacillus sp.]